MIGAILLLPPYTSSWQAWDDFIFTINWLKRDTQKPDESLLVVVMRHSLWWHTEEPSSWHSQTIPLVEQTSGSASLWCYGTWWLLPQDLHMDNKVLDMVWHGVAYSYMTRWHVLVCTCCFSWCEQLIPVLHDGHQCLHSNLSGTGH